MQKIRKAILVDVIHPRMLARHSFERLEELESLVTTYGGIVIEKRYQKRYAPHPKTFLGPGKIYDLAEEGKQKGVSLLIINNQLKPRQTYEIAEAMRPYGIEVWDRIDLILKIFAKHATTQEARLEIELASVRHMGPRIFGMGMELSRQGGGIGTVGIGETNIERMSRHLKEKERVIKRKLERYKNVRAGHRKSRKMKNLKTVALVGYTNAGKTTLLNKLTHRSEFAADLLFATLDTRVGQLFLPVSRSIALVSDTIGFIKQLPPELLNAFSSTLSEAVEADLLVHVVDASDKNAHQHIDVVEDILRKIGIHETPRLVVFNKIEEITSEVLNDLKTRICEDRACLFVSARRGDGLDALIEAIENRIV